MLLIGIISPEPIPTNESRKVYDGIPEKNSRIPAQNERIEVSFFTRDSSGEKSQPGQSKIF